MTVVGDVDLPEVGDWDGVISQADLFQARQELVADDILPNMVVANPEGGADIMGLEEFVSVDRMLASYANLDDWRAQLQLQAGLPTDTRALGRIANMTVYEVPEIPVEDDNTYGNTRCVVMNRAGGLETGVLVRG